MSVTISYVTDVDVSGFKKINKNYVYIIQTTWSDGMKFELYRKYGDFFIFQDSLLKLFPKEAGKYDSRERKIPYLPTMDNVFKLFGRTNSESVMQHRLSTINYYCKTVLLNLGDHITQSAVAIDFFRPTPNDKQQRRLGRPATLHPQKIPAGNVWEEFVLLADYEAELGKSQQLSAKANEVVVVMRKDESGWTLCTKQSTGKAVGWLPTSFLKKRDDAGDIELGFAATIVPVQPSDNSTEEEHDLEKYKAICKFTSEDPGQVSFPEGAIITIVDKDDDGWWFISFKDIEGWAPSSYLEPLTGLSITADELDEVYMLTEEDDDNKTTCAVAKMETFYARKDFEAELEDELTFTKGAAIEIINKSISGWWTGRYNGKTGLVPATFLTPDEPIKELEQTETNTTDPQTSPQSQPKKVSFGDTLLGASLAQSSAIGAACKKYDRPPPRRKTVRHAMLQKN